MRGFALGTLGLIALYVFVQQGSSDKVSAAGGTLSAGLKRLSDPTVAGIHQTKTPGTVWHDPAAPPATGGGTQHLPHAAGPPLPPTTIQV